MTTHAEMDVQTLLQGARQRIEHLAQHRQPEWRGFMGRVLSHRLVVHIVEIMQPLADALVARDQHVADANERTADTQRALDKLDEEFRAYKISCMGLSGPDLERVKAENEALRKAMLVDKPPEGPTHEELARACAAAEKDRERTEACNTALQKENLRLSKELRGANDKLIRKHEKLVEAIAGAERWHERAQKAETELLSMQGGIATLFRQHCVDSDYEDDRVHALKREQTADEARDSELFIRAVNAEKAAAEAGEKVGTLLHDLRELKRDMQNHTLAWTCVQIGKVVKRYEVGDEAGKRIAELVDAAEQAESRASNAVRAAKRDNKRLNAVLRDFRDLAADMAGVPWEEQIRTILGRHTMRDGRPEERA